MKLRKVLALVLVLALSVTVFTGCQGAPAPSTSQESSTGSESSTAEESTPSETESSEADTPAAMGGEITVNLGQEPPEMNSITTTSTGSMDVLRHIMDGLIMLDQEDNPVPAIAESWETSNDDMTYTFHLRQDAKWTNGDPVVAGDFIYAWNQHFTAETAAPYASTWATYIKGAAEMLNDGVPAEGVGYKAIDDYTLELNLAIPCKYILPMMAFPSFFPMNQKAYEAAGGVDTYGKEADTFCTNGPFKVESWEHENEFVIAKNTDYYDADSIALDKITYVMIDDSTTAYNSYVAGELDMIGLSADQVEMAKNDGFEEQTKFYNDAGSWYFEFGVSKNPALANANIRKALTYAVDAETYVNTLIKNNSEVGYCLTPTAVNHGEFTAKAGKLMDREGYAADDYAGAKQLLADGLAELNMTAADLNLTLIADDGDQAQKDCAYFQEQWKSHLGVDVQVQQMTYKQRLERMNNHDFDIVFAGWGPDYNDPMSFLDMWITDGGNNHTGWSNAEYDKLIDSAYHDGNDETRTQSLIDAEKILAEEMPIGTVYYRSRAYAVSERVDGILRTGFQNMNYRWASVKG